MTALAVFWACWILLQAGLVLCVPWLARSARSPVTNGFVIVIPDHVRRQVTQAELAALVAHERGHMALGHMAVNFLLRCVFIPRWQALARQQEYAADDYAIRTCDPADLCRALRKLSFNDFDWKRAKRLERLATARAH